MYMTILFISLSLCVQVTFQNETTGEYQFFHVHFKSIAPGIISTVELVTAVRQGVSHTITIDNPFQTPVNMTTNVNCADVTLPSSFLIGGESQVWKHTCTCTSVYNMNIILNCTNGNIHVNVHVYVLIETYMYMYICV